MKILKFIIFLTLPIFAQDMLLLSVYKNQDISGFVMSEKLDGVRGYWDSKKLLSRQGKQILAPDFWTQNFPPFAIDGELYTKRDDFENIASIINSSKKRDDWRNIKLYVFDVPDANGTLIERLEVLQNFLDSNPNEFIKIIPQIKISSKEQMEEFFTNIVQNGGEGVVLRDPNLPYEAKRSTQALKYKKQNEANCKVIKINQGKGRYKDLMGSVDCEMLNGIKLKIGSGFSDKNRANPPKIGEVITFKYEQLNKNGVPKFARYLRVRID